MADKPAPSLRDVCPETPGWLIEIIEKLMAKSPDERFQSAAEVAELLGRHLHDLQESPSTTERVAVSNTVANVSPPAVVPSPRRQQFIMLTALTLVGIAIAALGIATVIEHSKSQISNSLSSAPHTTQSSVWYDWPADTPKPAIAPFNAKEAAEHQQAWAKHLGVNVNFTNSIGMKFILIPPGEFLMGSSPAEIEEVLAIIRPLGPGAKHWMEFIRSEDPQHKVILTQPVYLGVT